MNMQYLFLLVSYKFYFDYISHFVSAECVNGLSSVGHWTITPNRLTYWEKEGQNDFQYVSQHDSWAIFYWSKQFLE